MNFRLAARIPVNTTSKAHFKANYVHVTLHLGEDKILYVKAEPKMNYDNVKGIPISSSKQIAKDVDNIYTYKISENDYEDILASVMVDNGLLIDERKKIELF
jgi:hypothetical protein